MDKGFPKGGGGGGGPTFGKNSQIMSFFFLKAYLIILIPNNQTYVSLIFTPLNKIVSARKGIVVISALGLGRDGFYRVG